MEEVSMPLEYEILFGLRPPYALPPNRRRHTQGDEATRLTDSRVITYVAEKGEVTTEKMADDLSIDQKLARKILKRLGDRGDISRQTPPWGPVVYSPQKEGADRPKTVRQRVLDAITQAGEADADKIASISGLTVTQVKDAAVVLKSDGQIYVHKKYKLGHSWVPVWRISRPQ